MILVTTAGAASVTSTPYGVLTVYDASWANTRSTSSYANAYTCTGRQLDAETGLYYFRARLFHAQLGRFVNRDPVSGETNLSRYCLNRPSDLADPQGLYPIFVCCNFENSSGSKIWPETISCDSSMTPASCCAARAKGWGWLPAWRVLHAQYGECGNACRFYLMQSEVPVETAGGIHLILPWRPLGPRFKLRWHGLVRYSGSRWTTLDNGSEPAD